MTIKEFSKHIDGKTSFELFNLKRALERAKPGAAVSGDGKKERSLQRRLELVQAAIQSSA